LIEHSLNPSRVYREGSTVSATQRFLSDTPPSGGTSDLMDGGVRSQPALINVFAKFSEFVTRSQHRVGINDHGQPVIRVLRRFLDYCRHLEISVVTIVSVSALFRVTNSKTRSAQRTRVRQ
jgi:hypothetical protein